jgi:hypothetical protein
VVAFANAPILTLAGTLRIVHQLQAAGNAIADQHAT